MCTRKAVRIDSSVPHTVYKAVMFNIRSKKYKTPYMETEIPLEAMEGKQVFSAWYPEVAPYYRQDLDTMEAGMGYVHAYADIRTAAREFAFYVGVVMKNWQDFGAAPEWIPELWECETVADGDPDSCYSGIFDSDQNTQCIASRAVTFRRKITYHSIASIRKQDGFSNYIKLSEYPKPSLKSNKSFIK